MDYSFMHLNMTFWNHFFVHLVAVFILVRLLYFPVYKDRDFAFSYLVFSLIVFFVTFFLKDVTISLGFTFGLFAVFAILRYRTETISTKEMTYLFVVIGIAMINAVSELALPELIIANTMVVLIVWFAQSRSFLPQDYRKTIRYERIELIKPNRRVELLADLQERTGLSIRRIEIRNIDFVRDNANIRVFYRPDQAHARATLERGYDNDEGL